MQPLLHAYRTGVVCQQKKDRLLFFTKALSQRKYFSHTPQAGAHVKTEPRLWTHPPLQYGKWRLLCSLICCSRCVSSKASKQSGFHDQSISKPFFGQFQQTHLEWNKQIKLGKSILITHFCIFSHCQGRLNWRRSSWQWKKSTDMEQKWLWLQLPRDIGFVQVLSWVNRSYKWIRMCIGRTSSSSFSFSKIISFQIHLLLLIIFTHSLICTKKTKICYLIFCINLPSTFKAVRL